MSYLHLRLRRTGPLAVCLFAFGCGSSDTSNTTDAGSTAVADPNQGQRYNGAFTRAAGGTVSSADNSVRLTAGRGALAADTQITVNVLPPAAGTLTSVYDFGPDGTRFTNPVQLAVRLAAPVPAGQRAVLAFNRSGVWTPLAGSRVVDGVVTADVRHFTRYSVINVAATPASAYARLYHYAALVRESYRTVDLYVARGTANQLIGSQAQLAGGRLTEITAVTPGEAATFFIVPAGAGPTATRLWAHDTTLAPGQVYQVVTNTASTTPPVEERAITASVRVDDLADLQALPSKTLRITLVPNGRSMVEVNVYDTSRTPPALDGAFDPSLTLDVDTPQGETSVGFEVPGSGITGLAFCYRLRFADVLAMTTEPIVWLFIGSNPRSASASDSIATFDLGNGRTVSVDPVDCPR